MNHFSMEQVFFFGAARVERVELFHRQPLFNACVCVFSGQSWHHSASQVQSLIRTWVWKTKRKERNFSVSSIKLPSKSSFFAHTLVMGVKNAEDLSALLWLGENRHDDQDRLGIDLKRHQGCKLISLKGSLRQQRCSQKGRKISNRSPGKARHKWGHGK